MDNQDTTYKKVISVGVFIVCIGVALGGAGYGYKQVKDANFLNSDSTRFISVKGVSSMEISADRELLEFTLTGYGPTEEEAVTKFQDMEKKLYQGLEGGLASKIEKMGDSAYYDEAKVITFYKTRSYRITFDDPKEDSIDNARLALLKYGAYEPTVRYTVKNPEEKFNTLTDLAMKDAITKAKVLVEQAGGKLGDPTFVAIGYYASDTQSYAYDNAKDFFYSMPSAKSLMTQNAYLTYKIK